MSGGVNQPINSGKKSVSVIGVFADNVGEVWNFSVPGYRSEDYFL